MALTKKEWGHIVLCPNEEGGQNQNSSIKTDYVMYVMMMRRNTIVLCYVQDLLYSVRSTYQTISCLIQACLYL